DNLRSFHTWQKWREIAHLVPIAVVDRVGPSLYANASTAAQTLSRFRIPEAAARTLPGRRPPAWVFLHGLKSPLSSTALRALRRREGWPIAAAHAPIDLCHAKLAERHELASTTRRSGRRC